MGARLIDDYGLVPPSDEVYSSLVGVPFYQSPEGPRRVGAHELVQKVDERRDSIPYPTFVPKTLFETLRDYFNNPEDKADNPNGVGILARRTVSVVEHIYIGMETNEVGLEVEEDTDEIIVPPIEQVFGSSGLGNAIRAHGSRRIVEADPSLGAGGDCEAGGGSFLYDPRPPRHP